MRKKADVAYHREKEAQITIDKNLHSEVCGRMLAFEDEGVSAQGDNKMEDQRMESLSQPIFFLKTSIYSNRNNSR